MQCSIWPGLQQSWDDVVEVAAHADATGWHCCYVADHFMGDGGGFGSADTPTFEATAALAGLASLTSTIGLGTLVLSASYRHPAVLANWAVTADHLSGGRLTVGIGAGWQANEHAQYGIELPSPGVRVDRLEEYCQVLTSMWRAPTTSFAGSHYVLVDALCEPKPLQDPLPLLVGGKGDRMLGLVARYASAWNMWGLPEAIAERGAVLDRRCEAIGRDPSTVRRTTQALFLLTDTPSEAREFVGRFAPRAAVAGSAAELRATVEAWAAVGIDEVIVPDWILGVGEARRDVLDRLIADVFAPVASP